MSTEQAAASFNPEDASGLLDDARVTITNAVIDTFTAKAGSKNAGQTYINQNVTYKNGDQEVTERYLIGSGDQWAANAAKTGVISVGKDGGKLWNKSDVVKFWSALVNAGFPKEKAAKGDCSLLKGLDVHVKRVTTDGAYTDKNGKEQTRTVLLVTKIYGEKAAAPAAKQSVARQVTKPTNMGIVPPVAVASNEDIDTVATDTLIGLLAEGQSLPIGELGKAAFLPLTKAKKAAIRPAVIARITDPAFLGNLAEQGLIEFDGSQVSAAA